MLAFDFGKPGGRMTAQPQAASVHIRQGVFTPYREPLLNFEGWRRRRIRALNLAPLGQELIRQRREIVPAPLPGYGDGTVYWPCEVRVSEADWIDGVCLVRATDWRGPWPHEGDGPYLEASQLLEVRESPSRLPPPFINKTERKALGLGFAGAMIELVYRDGSSTLIGGEFFEFPPYPHDKGPADVVEVRTPTRDQMPDARFPTPPIWCLVP